MAWKYIRSLGFGCVHSAVHKQHLHGRNSIIGKLGTIGAPLTSISGTFVKIMQQIDFNLHLCTFQPLHPSIKYVNIWTTFGYYNKFFLNDRLE